MIFIYVLIIVEIFLILLIWWLSKDFQWLVTSKDVCPKLNKEKLKRFIDNGYDSFLGWERKVNTSKTEEVKTIGEIREKVELSTYSIDSRQARTNLEHKDLSEEISTYGDSFAFGRHVNDDQTWQWYLSI